MEVLKTITGRSDVNLIIDTHSRTLYGLCISLSLSMEKRLLIDLALIRLAYESLQITWIVCIKGSVNPADDFTKVEKRKGTLATLMLTNTFNSPMEHWVEHDLPKSHDDGMIPKKLEKKVTFCQEKTGGSVIPPSTSSGDG